MAKRKDKFSVGQQVMFVLGPASGWERINGEFGVIVEPNRLRTVLCANFGDRFKSVGVPRRGWRYAVRWGEGVNHFCVGHLRTIYEDEKLSTWMKFEKLTGLRISDPVEQ